MPDPVCSTSHALSHLIIIPVSNIILKTYCTKPSFYYFPNLRSPNQLLSIIILFHFPRQPLNLSKFRRNSFYFSPDSLSIMIQRKLFKPQVHQWARQRRKQEVSIHPNFCSIIFLYITFINIFLKTVLKKEGRENDRVPCRLCYLRWKKKAIYIIKT